MVMYQLIFKISVLLTPVVKDKKNKKLEDISNYRPVTITAVLSKLFEACVYRKNKDKLSVCGLQLSYVSEGGCENSLQLGYASKGRCANSLQVLSTVINHFSQERTDEYMLTLNVSAAFDNVNTNSLQGKL